MGILREWFDDFLAANLIEQTARKMPKGAFSLDLQRMAKLAQRSVSVGRTGASWPQRSTDWRRGGYAASLGSPAGPRFE
jgi:hypothetical protein